MEVSKQKFYFELNGKNILICSDGLFNSLEDQKILEIVKKEMDIKEKVHLLIEQAISCISCLPSSSFSVSLSLSIICDILFAFV